MQCIRWHAWPRLRPHCTTIPLEKTDHRSSSSPESMMWNSRLSSGSFAASPILAIHIWTRGWRRKAASARGRPESLVDQRDRPRIWWPPSALLASNHSREPLDVHHVLNLKAVPSLHARPDSARRKPCSRLQKACSSYASWAGHGAGSSF